MSLLLTCDCQACPPESLSISSSSTSLPRLLPLVVFVSLCSIDVEDEDDHANDDF
jgi:hypothetical protein